MTNEWRNNQNPHHERHGGGGDTAGTCGETGFAEDAEGVFLRALGGGAVQAAVPGIVFIEHVPVRTVRHAHRRN
jgi:hypothetical protein